ncbi:hypothetical protein VKT23_001762 [Stygiomarasmius scandens]|uniref:XPG-I domain-containing protein n=1 Tax=Marasmiellus scandens TaxID=2682957 RepID=A0ABR1K0D8_9AGAR
MGVPGLWGLLQSAQSTTTLTALSLIKFNTQRRGYRVGIDASIWFFHAEYGKEGENPELRTLFFRCAQLMNHGFLPLFVFDGPKRPDFKRGKRINKSAHKLVTGMQAIIEAFGFEYRTAPGEAEAELAWLNRIGIIDGILSDDVDTFLFGARTVIRNHSSTHPSAAGSSSIEKNMVVIYNLPQPDNSGFDPEDLIFIALCSGGDYDSTGIPSCGIKFAHGLAQAGFGKTLHKAALDYAHGDDSEEDLEEFLVGWRRDIAHELRTNASGFLPTKKPSLADKIPSTFPNVKVLMSYVCPETSESRGRAERYRDLDKDGGWLKKDPSLPMLAEKCEFYFEWGFEESIIKRFGTVIFHGLILRILRRVILFRDNNPEDDLDTITDTFLQQNFSSPSYELATYADASLPFVKKIHSTRQHASTSQTLEYRLEINPSFLVRLISSGVKGIRRPDDVDEWASDDEGDSDDTNSDNEKGKTKKGKKAYKDPLEPLRIWVPAVLVRNALPKLTEDFEEALRRKEEKKAGNGRKRKTSPSKSRPKATTKTKAKENLPVDAAVPKLSKKGKDKHKSTLDVGISDGEYDLNALQPPSASAASSSKARLWASSDEEEPLSRTSKSLNARPQSKGPVAKSQGHEITSFFNASKPNAPLQGKSKGTKKSPSTGSTSYEPASPSKIVSALNVMLSRREKPAVDSSGDEGYKRPQPEPFPMLDPLDDDPFLSDDIPPPIPPETPSTRDAYPDPSSDDLSDTFPPSEQLDKSPRKSTSHLPRKPSAKDAADDKVQVKRTIKDVQHPARVQYRRAASPTPASRTPNKTLVSMNGGTKILSGRSSSPIDISDIASDSDGEAPVAPKFKPIPTTIQPVAKERRRSVLSKPVPAASNRLAAGRKDRRPLEVARAKARSKTDAPALLDIIDLT